MRMCSRWQDRLAVWFRPPGWRAPDVLARLGPHRFDLAVAAAQRFDPPVSRARQLAALVLFVAVLAGALALLWEAHRLAVPLLAAGAGALIAGLWTVGWLSTPREPRPVAVAAARA
jgi:hypothetical protein